MVQNHKKIVCEDWKIIIVELEGEYRTYNLTGIIFLRKFISREAPYVKLFE